MVENPKDEHFVVTLSDVVAAIEFAIRQPGLLAADRRDILGSLQRGHDISHKKRKLLLEHVCALHDKLLIPADVLIQAY